MTEPVRPEDMRVSDDDRRGVQDRLQRAHDTGQLDLTEFDERVKAVWAARTRRDLEGVTADLPELPSESSGRPPVFSDTGGGIAMRILTIIWASASAVNLAVWGLLAANGVVLYPWWQWVLVPGLVLLVLYVAGIGRPPR